jgi:glutamate formiminotransferase
MLTTLNMNRIVECVPNFSEGRKAETIDLLVREIESIKGVVVLGTHIDSDHNRSVITFVGSPETIVDAAVKAVGLAAQLIDLRVHTGEHPRLGATDVLPFVPVQGVTMEECVALAHRAGERIANELGIPVYFYERAALRSNRVNLEDVRRGGFELLSKEISTVKERAPDVGEAKIHPTAGATIVGARPILIAFNVNLRTSDIKLAHKIARAVRGSSGGLRYLKALGIELKERGIVQISMNLVNHEKTSLHHAFEAVKREAEHYGVSVEGSEIVGLVPQEVLNQCASYFLRLEHPISDLVLERRIYNAIKDRRE